MVLWLGSAVLGLAKKSPASENDSLLPKFSQPSGSFATDLTLKIQSPSSGGVILYTLDGSEPTASSQHFTQELVVTNSTLIRARILKEDQSLGPVRSEHYLLVSQEAAAFSSNLPLLILDTCGNEPLREHKSHCALRLVESGTGRTSLIGPANDDGRALINLRGRASLRYPKRSYTLKLIDDQDEPRESSLLGFPKDEDWILYAPYPDKTLMRDVLAYEMGRAMGHWTPGTRFVEVFVTDGRSKLSLTDYVGVYVLEERIKRHPHRMNLEKLTPSMVDEPEITGGYIFKKDHVDRGYYGPPDLLGGGTYTSSSSGRAGFPTPPGGFPALASGFLPTVSADALVSRSRETSFEGNGTTSSSRRALRASRIITNILTAPVLRETESTSRTLTIDNDGTEIIESIEEGFSTSLRTNQFYWVLPEEDEVTPVQRTWLKRYLDRFESVLYGSSFDDPEKGYSGFIDIPSFVDYHMITEVTKNVDGHRFSTFFTKDRGGKIRMEPMWDWNLSFGNCNGKQGWIPQYWLWPQLNDTEYTWFRRLFEDPDFGQHYVDRWAEMETSVFATDRLMKRIDELALQLQESQRRNFERWPILGKGVNPNYFVGDSYDEEVEWMKRWLKARLEWIHVQFVPAPQADVTPQADATRKIEWSAGPGELYYTTDGTDPRLRGGQASSTAEHGTHQTSLKNGAALFARRQLNGQWSAPLRLAPVL